MSPADVWFQTVLCIQEVFGLIVGWVVLNALVQNTLSTVGPVLTASFLHRRNDKSPSVHPAQGRVRNYL